MGSKSNRVWIVNAMVAAIYIVLSLLVNTFGLASGNIQFRLSESLNHLVVFNRKYFWGVVGGVFLFNLFGPTSLNHLLDVVFGTGQTVIALLITIYVAPRLKNIWAKMGLNVIVFTVSMVLIALELHWTLQIPFWATYLSTAISEFVIMIISAPIMYGLDKVLDFNNRI
ncbi:QueT transporter family protein [Pediococcus claussenii]|uniref:QueT transporter family protein n=1 Tax=Pediococcus claussenii (strain ATCC BAA-344 / DSM 14800 / JCM 18046 / KCTC 3811 / LMG 21948 / P06) TaxID=701521 RepID=G8PAB6_PEDCP|nr:QueT transporter family protein [Pediococcus claussenii]AEV94555.1 queT transporter family protein [Pediococcus claussenii ATCC BAA-344]ANZ69770.1 hypothetical protein AYR57_05310 [Pediococcus claussenii]ANZ71587.1 hypothetical protein AYR58_05315 [Pediococcus claussenii]KRN19739.1 hypothetical protein IV79_GL001026 [Pediococcus claussenii]